MNDLLLLILSLFLIFLIRFSTLKVSASLFSVSVLILSRFSLISASILLRVTDKV